MSKWDKLLTRICALSKDLRFDELRKVLESYGSVSYTHLDVYKRQECMQIVGKL